MASFPTVPPPVAAPQPLSAAVAAALSFLVPGLGLVYAGSLGPAIALFALNQLGPLIGLLIVALGGGPQQMMFVGGPPYALAMRLIAVPASIYVVSRRKQAVPTPVGVYAVFVIAWLILGFYVVPSLVASRIPAIEISAASPPYAAGDALLARKFGGTASPHEGRTVLYFLDPPDSGVTLTTGYKRNAWVGRVGRVEQGLFTIDGLDASVPTDDYAGEPVGVLRAARTP